MTTITVLPPSLASQIAAGEVVERPASAVKELVENALDAGATRCDVQIEGGGITRVSIADDGTGMSRDDALLSVERHATSKLGAIEDLGRVRTFGFRGEALPSIASVSRLSLSTRTRDSETAVKITVEGGGRPSVSPAGAPVGTTVEVLDLFFNVPARRKFLRSTGTESGHVTDVVEAAALSQPGVTFTLERDGRQVREYLRAPDREARVRAALDEELAPCRGERGPLRIEAFVSRPERARAGAAGLRLFINGRSIKDRALAMTIAQAYGSVLERGRYPRGAVFLELPPQLVDVNVHPQKGEVRFADARAVTDAVYHVLSVQLARAFSLPTPPRSPWAARRDEGRPWRVTDAHTSPERPPPAAASRTDTLPSFVSPVARDPTLRPGETAPAVPGETLPAVPVPAASAEPPGEASSAGQAPIEPSPRAAWSRLSFIAQVRKMYLLCEGEDGLYIIDQHAAAERVNFDRLMKQYRSRAVASQSLLFPLTLPMASREVELVSDRGDDFAALGLDLRVRGPEAISVHSVPKLLSRASPEQLVRDLMTEVSRSGSRAFSEAIDLSLATMACHGSIRAGEAVAREEATALLSALDQADFAGHCPHGRPVVAFSSWAELERKVGRR